MQLCKPLSIIVLTAIISGCSSPPPPVPVDWAKPATSMNESIPQWQDNNVIIPAKTVTGKWSQYIPAFNKDNIFSTDIYYAVAHSSRIIISAQTGTSFFSAKQWLREHGAKGLIEFRSKTKCLTCSTTEIYFYR